MLGYADSYSLILVEMSALMNNQSGVKLHYPTNTYTFVLRRFRPLNTPNPPTH
jgi:hypothetical protein